MRLSIVLVGFISLFFVSSGYANADLVLGGSLAFPDGSVQSTANVVTLTSMCNAIYFSNQTLPSFCSSYQTPVPIYITVTPLTPGINVGATQQFIATGIYSDATSQNITSLVTWTSGTTSVATIVAGGLATGIGVGSSVITATLGNVSGNTTLSTSIGAATKLVFTTQPSNTTTSAAISPSVVVKIEDAYGNTETSSSASVSLTSSPTGLGGTTTVSASSGIATFSGLTLLSTGTYTLNAASAGLPSVTSNPFTVSTAVAAQPGDVAVDVGNNTLYKLRAADGTIIWGPVNRGNCGGIAVDQVDLGVYTGGSPNCTGGGSGAVYKYDTSGVSVWSANYAGCGTPGNYYVGNGGIAVDTTSATPGVVLTLSGYYGNLGKVSRTNGSTLFCDATHDLGRPSIDPNNGQIYVISNAGSNYNYNTLYSTSAAGSLISASSCEGYTDLNPADGTLYRGGNGCGTTLYQMNKSTLGATNWSLDLSSYITSFDALALQPWSGGYIYAASVTSSKIVVIDPATQTVVRTFSTAVTPNYIAVNPSGGNIYITNSSSHFVYAYSPTGSLVWTSPDLGGPAYNIATAREVVGGP